MSSCKHLILFPEAYAAVICSSSNPDNIMCDALRCVIVMCQDVS